MNPGDTYIDAATAARSGHLRLVVGVTPAGEDIVVGCATRRPPCDDSCVLQAGEHPRITRETIIDFPLTTIEQPGTIARQIAAGVWSAQPPVSPAVLDRIRQGADNSPRLKPAHKVAIRRATGQTTVVVRRRLTPRQPGTP